MAEDAVRAALVAVLGLGRDFRFAPHLEHKTPKLECSKADARCVDWRGGDNKPTDGKVRFRCVGMVGRVSVRRQVKRFERIHGGDQASS